MEGIQEIYKNNEAKTLMNETVCKYMAEFKLAKVFKSWFALHCYKKTLEYNLIVFWIRKGQQLAAKGFSSWKWYYIQKARNRDIQQKLDAVIRLHLVQKYFRDWFKAVKKLLSVKKNIFSEWKKVHFFNLREKKIESLKTKAVHKNLENLAIKMLFGTWKNCFILRIELKKKSFLGLKIFLHREKTLKFFRERRIQGQKLETDLKVSIFQPWWKLVQKIRTIKKSRYQRLLFIHFQQLLEYSKKSFTKKLFNQKILNHLTDTIKIKYFKALKIHQKQSMNNKYLQRLSIKLYEKVLYSKHFTALSHNFLLNQQKKTSIIKSFKFWTLKTQSLPFKAFKIYLSQRKNKHSKLRQAKYQRIFDLQQSTLFSWIDLSLQLKETSEKQDDQKKAEKMNKIWKIVQKFVEILKIRTRKRLKTHSQPTIPKVNFMTESVLELSSQSRKRPEPRRLNILSTIN